MEPTARQARDERFRSEQALRAMVAFSPGALVVVDAASGGVWDANEAAEKLLGRRHAELLTLGLLDLSPAVQAGGRGSASVLKESLAHAVRGEELALQWTALGANNAPIVLELHAHRLPSIEPVLVHVSIVDVTAHRHAQEQLAQVQKLEALAHLAGGVTHDLNNMLAEIIAGAELARLRLPPDHPAREDLASVVAAAERAALVIRQLRALGSKPAAAPSVIDVDASIEQTRDILQRLLGADVQLVLELTPAPRGVLIDPAEVEQIVLGLAASARATMPRGGRLTIQTASVLVEQQGDLARDGLPRGHYMLLRVSDTGDGIPDASPAHVFDPLVATQGLAPSVRLGLAAVRGVVEKNGGHIRIESERGTGTTFSVYFPLA